MRAGLARGWAGEGRFLPAKKCTGEMVCAGVRGDLHSDVQVGMAPPRPTDLLRVLASVAYIEMASGFLQLNP